MMTTTVTGKLLDVLNGSELSLIYRILKLRVIDLQMSRESTLKYAAQLVAEPDRQQFYQAMADDAEHEITAITALLARHNLT